jgi:ferredoxin
VIRDGQLVGMEFEKGQGLGEPPEFIACDEVLLAVGQMNAFPWIEPDAGIAFDQWGLPVLDPLTLQSSLPQVFFGGDAAFGPRNIITAVAQGHQAAISMDLYCQGKPVAQRPAPQVNLAGQKMGVHDWLYHNQVAETGRQAVPMLSTAKSLKDRLLEVELGFDRKIGQTESLRCLNCDVQTVFLAAECIECDACVDACPESCINFVDNGSEEALRTRLRAPAQNLGQSLYVSGPLATGRVMVKDENVCLHCGICAERCPTSAWEMQKFIYQSAQAGQL